MKLSVLGFNQKRVIQEKLDLIDLEILNYIMYANGNPSMSHIIEDEISYVWLSHKKILEDLPVLNIVEGTLRNRLNNLKANGLIISKNVGQGIGRGSKTYYSITIKCLSLQYTDVVDEDFNECHSKMTPRRNSKMTPDNKLIDNKLNTNISKDILVADKSAHAHLSENISKEDTYSDITVKSKNKKRNRYEQFMDVVDEYTEDEKLRELLKEYARVRIEKSKEDGDDKTFFASKFKGIIKHLSELSNDIEMQYKIVQQSIDKRYRILCPLNDNYSNSKQSMINRGIQMTEKDATAFKDGKEAKEYTENLIKENERRGRRAVF